MAYNIRAPGHRRRVREECHADRGQGTQPSGQRGAARARRQAVPEDRKAGLRPRGPGDRGLQGAQPRQPRQHGGRGDPLPEGRHAAGQGRVARPQPLGQPRRRGARPPGQAAPRQAPQAPRAARRRRRAAAAAGRHGRAAPRDVERAGRPPDSGRAGPHPGPPAPPTLEHMTILDRALRLGEAKQFKQYAKRVERINAWEPELELLDDDELRQQADSLRERARNGEDLEDLLPETFALVREVSRRQMGMRHFDAQMTGGRVLPPGATAEIKTGGGKTLPATVAVVLNALAGEGVHVVTVNDYLARRDAEWM